MVYRILLIFMLFTGCKGVKNIAKSDQSKVLKESVLSRSKRDGDSIQITLPNIKLKDTTIYSYNKVGTQLITRYEKDGSIDVKCIESSVYEMKLAVKELTEKQSQKEKTEEFGISNTTVLIVAGFVLLIIVIGFIFLFVYFKRLL